MYEDDDEEEESFFLVSLVFIFYHISIIKSYLEERSIPEEDDDDDDDCRVFFLIHIVCYVKYLTNSHDFGVWFDNERKRRTFHENQKFFNS